MIDILVKLTKAIGDSNILWGVGGSFVLEQYKLTDKVNDIDILVNEKDFQILSNILLQFSMPKGISENSIFSTKQYNKYITRNIEVDLMGGFCIKHNEGEYHYILDEISITKNIDISGVNIPLTALEDWYILYQLIPNRDKKVEIIEKYLRSNGAVNYKLLERALQQSLPINVRSRIEELILNL